MGYGSYEVTRSDGKTIWAGYGHNTRCEKKGCRAKIDRGLAYLCGEHPGGDEWGCGGYFWEDHLFMASSPMPHGVNWLCEACSDKVPDEEEDE